MEFDYKILIKYLYDDLSETELGRLLEWRKESPVNEDLFGTLMKLRLNHRYRENDNSERVLTALTKVNRKKSGHSVLLRIKSLTKYAAVFLLVLSLSLLFIRNFSDPADEQDISIVVAAGEPIKKLSLADGTVVWLNESSSLKIPQDFSSQKRTVTLEGEAYFDVKKNYGSPFFVEASKLQLKVAGTSFNVNNRKENGVVETILVSGKVFLLNEKQQAVYEMFPGEKVVFTPEQNEYKVNTVDTNVSTAWHLDQLRFENSTLRDIVNKLALIYDVNINLESKKLADRKYRCVINRDETLEEVLDILCYLAPLRYRIEGDEVFIYE